MKFSFIHSEQERLEVDVHGYAHRASGRNWDDNLLTADIRVAAGGFRGKACATVLTSDLTSFLSELRLLSEALSGSAQFQTADGQLSLGLVGDGKGHIKIGGEVRDQPKIGNRLYFAFRFGKSQLRAAVRNLKRVASQFPVRAG